MSIKTVFLLICISLLLSSCGHGPSGNKASQLLSKINTQVKSKYNLDYGEVIAAYDLAKLSSKNQIFAPDFGSIINEDSHNTMFLQKLAKRYRDINHLGHEASIKLVKINDLLSKLNTKYHILSKSQLSILRSSNKHSDSVKSLAILKDLDEIVQTIPIMLGVYRPTVTSHYGMRNKHPIHGKRKFHCGIDLKARKSSPVYAAAKGIVVSAGKMRGYGNIVEIKHGHFRTRYAHLKHIDVHAGSAVIRGQKIGTQGNTGNTTGEHLHFEIWLNNKHIEPFDFIAHAL